MCGFLDRADGIGRRGERESWTAELLFTRAIEWAGELLRSRNVVGN
jgi:hypothetical protein